MQAHASSLCRCRVLCLGYPPYLSLPRHILFILRLSMKAAFFRKASGNVSWVKNPITCLPSHHQPQVSMTLKGQIFLLGVCAPGVDQVRYKANAQPILVERICAKISQDPRGQISVQRSQGEKKTFLSLQLFYPEINSIQLQKAGTPLHTYLSWLPSPTPFPVPWPNGLLQPPYLTRAS